jgi:hypothetical protein
MRGVVKCGCSFKNIGDMTFIINISTKNKKISRRIIF